MHLFRAELYRLLQVENSSSLCSWGLAFPLDGGNTQLICPGAGLTSSVSAAHWLLSVRWDGHQGLTHKPKNFFFLSNHELKILVAVDIFVNLCCNGFLGTLYDQALSRFPLFPYGCSLYLTVCSKGAIWRFCDHTLFLLMSLRNQQNYL